MAGTVSNGGIGKSPAIDKINLSNQNNIRANILEKMEYLVCEPEDQRNILFQKEFENCKKEFFRQLTAMHKDEE